MQHADLSGRFVHHDSGCRGQIQTSHRARHRYEDLTLHVLRMQLERRQEGYSTSLREYNRVFGVTRARLERATRYLCILHPGPMNRGVEIDSDVADGPHSVILDQVTNGVAVRMAVLYLLAGGKPELAEAAKKGVS